MFQEILNKKAAMIIAFESFKDEEYFRPKEILEKAGLEIITVSNQLGSARGAEGGESQIDIPISQFQVDDYQAVIFVGGPGCLKWLDNQLSYQIAQESVRQNKILAAICISPVILAKAGVLEGKKATVWSSLMDRNSVKILQENGAVYQDKEVVVDGKIITANGPRAAQAFAESIIDALR